MSTGNKIIVSAKPQLKRKYPKSNDTESLPEYISVFEKQYSQDLHCSICDVYVNSEAQLKQHFMSLRHQNTVNGEPLPPKQQKADLDSSSSTVGSESVKVEFKPVSKCRLKATLFKYLLFIEKLNFSRSNTAVKFVNVR